MVLFKMMIANNVGWLCASGYLKKPKHYSTTIGDDRFTFKYILSAQVPQLFLTR
jgi:hypothetical protein